MPVEGVPVNILSARMSDVDKLSQTMPGVGSAEDKLLLIVSNVEFPKDDL